MRVGLIGFGAIARGLLRLVEPQDGLDFVSALVRQPAKARGDPVLPVCSTVQELLGYAPDVVVEAGGHNALRSVGPAVLRGGVDLILVSVGALADPTFETEVVTAAKEGRSRAIVASGAIGALDALASAAVGGLTRVTHITRKPASALLPLDEANALTAPRELFRGSARQGVLLFPESVNVAAAVSLAGIGLDRTELCVIADPQLERNTHEVIAEGAFGELRFSIRNVPTQENPRTGKLVAMSILHLLRRRTAPLAIG
ncbi:MAG: aspartate dehydrogenase [Chloroflexi bacterium]|nr:aspartate dehydrogenase [Chloroflexota bacterium]MBV9894661.1 aspartate dehydrogenase [Chloroflexota bacterium]